MRTTFFTVNDLMTVQIPNQCFIPEYTVPMMAAQLYLFGFAILLFEGTTQVKVNKRTE